MLRPRPRTAFIVASLFVIVFFAPADAAAQEYYGVPIENGGVAFLVDVSGSMDNRAEKIADSFFRGLAGAIQGTSAEQSQLGQAIIQRGNRGPQPTKMGAARQELMTALASLRDGTNFTIITFGKQAAEWPGGVRAAGAAATADARRYVATLAADGGTPMAEALELGFGSPNVRTLFVVSDGRPTTASVLPLVRQLQASREGRRMVINTIGIGRDQDHGLLCQLALDNEGVYVRDGAVACTFSPCFDGDGIVTFYPRAAIRKHPNVTPICSSAEHPDCTAELVYETMRSDTRFQTPTRERADVMNCLELEDPDPVTIVINDDGLEATNYTRPGHPLHPGRVTRIVKPQGDNVVVETTIRQREVRRLRPHRPRSNRCRPAEACATGTRGRERPHRASRTAEGGAAEGRAAQTGGRDGVEKENPELDESAGLRPDGLPIWPRPIMNAVRARPASPAQSSAR